MFLIGAALLVYIVGVGAFWIVDVYQVNPMWVFSSGPKCLWSKSKVTIGNGQEICGRRRWQSVARRASATR